MSKFIQLRNGVLMPKVNLGTFSPHPASKEEMKAVTLAALKMGYIGIDTAYFYRTEAGIGLGLKEAFESGLKRREDVFVTTKIWMTYMRYDRVKLGLQKSLQDLGLDYVDLLLMHYPMSLKQQDDEVFPKDANGEMILDNDIDYLDTWRAMEEAYDEGLVKAIGFSNFNQSQITRLLANCRIPPAMIQLESHPRNMNDQLIQFVREQGIAVTAFCPIGKGSDMKRDGIGPLVEDPIVQSIAEKHHKTTAQILIAFALTRNLCVAVKSYYEPRMLENLEANEIQLDDDDIQALSDIKDKERLVSFPWSARHPHYPFH